MAPYWLATSQTAKFIGPTWAPSGSCRPQMGPMFAPWTLLSGLLFVMQDPGGLISTSLELYTQLWLALFYCYPFLYINIIYPYSALGHMSKMNWCQTMKYDKVHTARILWNVLTKYHSIVLTHCVAERLVRWLHCTDGQYNRVFVQQAQELTNMINAALDNVAEGLAGTMLPGEDPIVVDAAGITMAVQKLQPAEFTGSDVSAAGGSVAMPPGLQFGGGATDVKMKVGIPVMTVEHIYIQNMQIWKLE